MTRHGLGPQQLSLEEDPAGSSIRGHSDLHNRVLRDIFENFLSWITKSFQVHGQIWLTYWIFKGLAKNNENILIRILTKDLIIKWNDASQRQ